MEDERTKKGVTKSMEQLAQLAGYRMVTDLFDF
jgi:hypothetical protein